MPNNKNRNKIVKVAVTAESLKKANRYLAAAGYRICAYTGEILTLTAKNFHRMAADPRGFQPISKVGKELYNNNSLDAIVETQPYERNQGATTELL